MLSKENVHKIEDVADFFLVALYIVIVLCCYSGLSYWEY